jgi:glycosyltransferase involved in cell wall biosynthesis
LFDVGENQPVLLFAGRISLEKGVMEIPRIYRKVKRAIPDLKLVIAGSGPAEESLRKAIPEAVFLGWQDPSALPGIYSSADLLLLPSRFDTFSCVVVEAMACGLPVVAYNCKGPKDIIENEVNGYLVEDQDEMIARIRDFFANPEKESKMPLAALQRSKSYLADPILQDLLYNTGLVNRSINPA